MRIGVFSDSYEPQVDGTVTVVRTLERGLEYAGHTVHIVTVWHPDAVARPNVIRIPSVRLPTEPQYRLGLLPASPRVRHLLEGLDLDIVHSHSPGPLGRLALHTAKALEIPIIFTSHTAYEDRLHYLPFGRRIARRYLSAVARRLVDRHTAIVAPSRKMEKLLYSYGISVPVHVVPNGIPLGSFATHPGQDSILAFRRRFGIQERERVISFVGRIAKEKALDVLLRNYARVARERPATRLLLVGDGPETEALGKLAHELGLEGRVIFTGYLAWPQEVSQALHASDLFVSASHTEVHPVSFLEALATGAPVVAYRDPSIEDVVTDGENGFLFDDKERLHEGMLRVLDMSPEAYQKLRRSSLDKAKAYSAETFVDRMIEVYQRYAPGGGESRIGQ
jgi:1,2-diacylglycerol 3-alpha-glucosyltransferase